MTHEIEDAIEDRPVLFLLHALGGSTRAWEGVAASLGAEFETVAIDLPGFGDAPASLGTSVQAMADVVADVVRGRAPARWLLIGHSMGGKIASIVAARTLAGEPGLFGLMGVVLLAASPPSPEPMDEARRATMIGWAANHSLDDAAAREFIDTNIGGPLAPADDRIAMADLKRSSREAWLAWLERGSREDWSEVVGTLDLPALIIVGDEDGDLGEAGQRATNMRVYPRSEWVSEPGAGHLLPLERTQAVATHIRRFWQERAGIGAVVPLAYARLIASDRVSRRTRSILAIRALPDAGDYRPTSLTPIQLQTLREIADRVVPQTGPAVDLAARLDTQLGAGKGDGWRFASLPADCEAYAAALNALEPFAALSAEDQHAQLKTITAGQFESSEPKPPNSRLSPLQLKHWFEDARTDLVRLWLAHPATLAHIGFDGFASGGDGPRKQGFDRIAAGETEAWEPMFVRIETIERAVR